MNKKEAKSLSKSGKVTPDKIRAMLIGARKGGEANNQKKSVVNKSLSKAFVFSLFWSAFKKEIEEVEEGKIGWTKGWPRELLKFHPIAICNMLREFGDYYE